MSKRMIIKSGSCTAYVNERKTTIPIIIEGHAWAEFKNNKVRMPFSVSEGTRTLTFITLAQAVERQHLTVGSLKESLGFFTATMDPDTESVDFKIEWTVINGVDYEFVLGMNVEAVFDVNRNT